MENNNQEYDFLKKFSEGIEGFRKLYEEKKKSLIENSPENERPIIEKLFNDMGVNASVSSINNAMAELNKELKR